MIDKDAIVEKLKLVEDPEIGLDIVTIELLRDIAIKDNSVVVTMTLTTPMCPYGPTIMEEVKSRCYEVEGVEDVDVVLSFEPMWEPSDDLKMMLDVHF
jgi:metal-sulfur cluster biosynthetic enzyme